MVHTTCAVKDCPSSSQFNKLLKFHEFPRTEERCELWIAACGRDDLIGRPAGSMRNEHICELHFLKPMYKNSDLKKSAIPVKNLPAPTIRIKNDLSTKISTPIQNKKLEQRKEQAAQTDPTPQDTSLTEPIAPESKKLKLSGEDDGITEEQFLKGCDNFLSPQLAAIVKTHLRLKKEASPDPLHE